MEKPTSYTPIFRGQFPVDPFQRWAAIRSFLGQWCGSDAAATAEQSASGELVEAARRRCVGALSYSVERWLTLADSAGESETPSIRDCPAFEPMDGYCDGAVTGRTVILVSGEQDVFWAVDNGRLEEQDPPVEVYQHYDPSHPPLIGRNESVSEFALKYLCLYNEFAPRCSEWFSADGTDEELRAARGWFDHALLFDTNDGWCGPLWLLEREGIAAIGRGDRLEVSVFGDPATLGMPPFLTEAMEQHLELRRQFKSS